MSETEKRVPELRFKGFIEDWEQRKLEEDISVVGGATPSKSNPEYWNGSIVWLSSQEIKEKYVSKGTYTITNKAVDDNTTKMVKAGTPLIVSRSGILARLFPISIPTTDVAINQDIKALIFDPNIINTNFFVAQLQKNEEFILRSIVKTGTTVQSINMPDFYKLQLSFPSTDEQEKVGKFFHRLDDAIALHQRKLILLKQLKQTYLYGMFPQNKKKSPALRFAGFSDSWEQRKFGHLVTQIIREVPKPDHPYERISVKSHAKGTFHQKVEDPKTVAMDKLYVVKENDLIVNITFAWEHAIAVANKSDDGLLVSHRFPTYRTEGKSDIDFLQYLVSQENFRRKLEFISPGGAGRNRVLNKKDFLNLKVTIPSNIDEQKKIGTHFKRIDNAIALHQCKIDKLTNLKQVLLIKMFL